MEIDDEAAFHIQKIRQHPVIQLRGQNLDKRNRTEFLAHTEVLPVAELKRSRCDEILCGQTGGSQPVPGEQERLRFIHMEDTMQLVQALPAVQCLGSHAQTLKVVENIGLNAFQTGLGGAEAVRVNAEGQILCFDQAVVALGKLVLQHGGVFLPNAVKIIALGRDVDTPGKAVLRCRKVQKRQLEPNGAVEIIEEIAPRFKNGGLVLILRQLVIDVLELDGLGIVAVCHPADAVRPDPLIGNTVLGGLFFLIAAVCPGNGRFDLLAVTPGQLFLWLFGHGVPVVAALADFVCRRQCYIPPCRAAPAALRRHRSCWFCRVSVWGE